MSDIYEVSGIHSELIYNLLDSIDNNSAMPLKGILKIRRIIELIRDEYGDAEANTYETRFGVTGDEVDISFICNEKELQPKKELLIDPVSDMPRIKTIYRAAGKCAITNHDTHRGFLQIPFDEDESATLEIFTPAEPIKEY